jgi:hypothetical protein
MAQQTAVEYYADKQLELHQKLKDNQISMIDFVVQSRDLLIESKQMFQQQIEAAWKRGDGEHDEVADKLAKQYYTETYTNEPR